MQNYDFNLILAITPWNGPQWPPAAGYINLETFQMVPKSLNLMQKWIINVKMLVVVNHSGWYYNNVWNLAKCPWNAPPRSPLICYKNLKTSERIRDNLFNAPDFYSNSFDINGAQYQG